MDLPKKVKIGGQTYKIVLVDHLEDKDGAVLLGEIEYGALTIRINRDMNEAWMPSILIHEIIHGILFYTGHYVYDSYEPVVSALGDGLDQFFRENPKVLALYQR